MVSSWREGKLVFGNPISAMTLEYFCMYLMSPIGTMVDGVGYTGRELQWPSLDNFQKAVVYSHDLFCRNAEDMVSKSATIDFSARARARTCAFCRCS